MHVLLTFFAHKYKLLYSFIPIMYYYVQICKIMQIIYIFCKKIWTICISMQNFEFYYSQKWTCKKISLHILCLNQFSIFQLSSTKDRENKTTLLHFLVEYAERDYPEVLNFYDELMHLVSFFHLRTYFALGKLFLGFQIPVKREVNA